MARRAHAAPSSGTRGKYDRHALPTSGRMDGEGEGRRGRDEAEASRAPSAKFGARAERARPRRTDAAILKEKKGRGALSKVAIVGDDGSRRLPEKKRSAWA